MCVAIYLAPGQNLSLDEVFKMHRNNADGVGIAWAKDGVVQWWKTLKVDPEYITKAIAIWEGQPRLVHFRYATAGGARVDLCHPFEIGPQANCRQTGMTGGAVLIHNGHWQRWDEVKAILTREGLLPDGPWSDSRLAALLANDDPDWLTALAGPHGKVAVMNGEGKVRLLGEWKKLREGVAVSNDHWMTTQIARGGYPAYKQWQGWNLNEEEQKAYWEEVGTKMEAEAKDKDAALKEDPAATTKSLPPVVQGSGQDYQLALKEGVGPIRRAAAGPGKLQKS